MSDTYEIEFSDRAIAGLKQLDKGVARRIVEKINWLAQNATTLNHYAMKREWAGLFRIRVGNYRVIYALNHEMHLILIEVIGHRREVYDD
jgi:mRNA interferase RelE/StbE